VSNTLRRRPGELASSVSTAGPFSEHPSEPQLIPGTLAACPVECTPRPRNLPEYQAACRAALGERVEEYNACLLVPGMRAWREGRFLAVTLAERKCVGDIVGPLVGTYETRREQVMDLRFEGDCDTEWLLAKLDTPVYCLVD
jgi:hypothetical protein